MRVQIKTAEGKVIGEMWNKNGEIEADGVCVSIAETRGKVKATTFLKTYASFSNGYIYGSEVR